jgi:hypothetical protein
MGFLDHKGTWRYHVQAPPQQCVERFVAAFSSGGGVFARARWDIERSGKGAVAIYQGRKGLVMAMTMFSQTASAEQEGAIGSKVTFEIEEVTGDRTVCAMWLSSLSTRMGFTNDARFMRPYMRAVETRLRELDPSVQVARD